MGKVSEFFGNPGYRPEIKHRADIAQIIQESQHIQESCSIDKTKEDNEFLTISATHSFSDESTDTSLNLVDLKDTGVIETSHSFTGLSKGFTDKALDVMVLAAGSQTVFIIVWIILIIWIVLGIVYSAPFNWQVVMQDGQSIQCYIWDTLLMRQQLMSTHEQILICSDLRSRLSTVKNFFSKLDFKADDPSLPELHPVITDPSEESITEKCNDNSVQENNMDQLICTGELPVENWYDSLSTKVSIILGSIPSMIIFWLGVIVWIICGIIPKDAGNSAPYTGETSGSNPRLRRFSDVWQMYINTAVAVSLLICSTFLQNIRARHDKFIARFLLGIYEMETTIDQKLRAQLGDFETQHKVITIPPSKRSRLEVVIDWYADIIGTGVGVVIVVAVFAVWLGIGKPLNWDDNWWLIIGTYTGLVGFLDGYVIRQVYFRITAHEEENYQRVADDDLALFQKYNIQCPEEYFVSEKTSKSSLSYKISSYINWLCADQWSVVTSLIIIIGLICVASGLKWSTTGQLIANTPTMIIEEFFLIVLIQAHNEADVQRRKEVTALFARRKLLLDFIERNLANQG
ncbi:Low-affinity Fe(2+) transport protein [Nakaseomyces bracarensis]|uniref:Low-affinity Fe(2+) transport protein n=1 Tax=Nakaseomyces bracarensis TaxID=273131 RepID=A0ABR4NQC6_9SACH